MMNIGHECVVKTSLSSIHDIILVGTSQLSSYWSWLRKRRYAVSHDWTYGKVHCAERIHAYAFLLERVGETHTALFEGLEGLVYVSTVKHKLQVSVSATTMKMLRMSLSGRDVIDRDAIFVYWQTSSQISINFILAALLISPPFQIIKMSFLEFITFCCNSFLLLFGIVRTSADVSNVQNARVFD